MHVFANVVDARRIIEDWKFDYKNPPAHAHTNRVRTTL